MKKIKFLHCADIHLDMPFTSLGTEHDKSAVRRQDLKNVFRTIIDTARKEAVDLILICGDFFEHAYAKKSTIHYVNDLFKSIPEIKVLIEPGNHDPYAVNSYYEVFNWSSNVFILSSQKPRYSFEDIGAKVFSLSYEKLEDEEVIMEGNKPNSSFINILLFHGTVDMNYGKNKYNPITSEKLASLNMDYIALGHFHNKLEDIGGYRKLFNPGSPEPLGFDEIGKEHGVFIGTLYENEHDDKNLECRFVKTNRRFYESIAVDVTGCSTNEQIVEKIKTSIKDQVDVSDGLYRITLKGYIEAGLKLDTAWMEQNLEGLAFYINVKDCTEYDYHFDEIVKEPGIRGVFTRKMLMKVEQAETEEEKRILMKALYFGIEALEKGCINT